MQVGLADLVPMALVGLAALGGGYFWGRSVGKAQSAARRDASDREAEALRHTEAKHGRTVSLLQATLESTADGILVVDVDGSVTAFNKRFLELWNIPDTLAQSGDDEKLLGYVISQLADPDGFLAKVKDLYDHPEEESFDTVEFKDDRFFERYSRPQQIDGEIVGRVWSFRDITKRKQAELALERSNADLQQFAYVASHDLREPLRMVNAYMGLLERRYGDKLDDVAKEYIGFASEGAQRMDRMVKDLLQLSRIESRGETPEPIEATEVLKEALDNLEQLIFESNAEIDCGSLPKIRADRSQAMRLFQNLLGNAIKYRGDANPVRVRIDAKTEHGMAVFSVTDNGIGIEADYLNRVFVIFQRLHARKDYPGTGIGVGDLQKNRRTPWWGNLGGKRKRSGQHVFLHPTLGPVDFFLGKRARTASLSPQGC